MYGDSDATDKLRAFVEWLPIDPRIYSDSELETKWSEFNAKGNE